MTRRRYNNKKKKNTCLDKFTIFLFRLEAIFISMNTNTTFPINTALHPSVTTRNN